MFPLECFNPVQCYVLILPSEETKQLMVFLHGLGDTAQNFARTPVVQTTLLAMKQGTIEPAAILIPDGGRGYWYDWADGENLYESWTLDTIDRIQNYYDLQDVGLIGVSMGGYASLSIGMRHPERFHTIVAYSPTDLEIALSAPNLLPVYHNMFGKEVFMPHAFAVSPRELVLRGAGHNQRIGWVIGDQEQDKFWQGSTRLETTMSAQGLNPKVRVVEGGDHSFRNTWTVESTEWWLAWWKESPSPVH